MMDLDLGSIKCEPNSPGMFIRCSQQTLDDCFLSRDMLPDYNIGDDYSPDRPYLTDGTCTDGSMSPVSPTSVDSKLDYLITSTLSPDLENGGEQPKRICLVCGDIASGYHYGVSSCEACKAFFKRTIQGNIDYSCPANGECEITKRRRKACQACRFQKCLNMGMLKEGVRLDRVRGGRQKYKRISDSSIIVIQQQCSSHTSSHQSSQQSPSTTTIIHPPPHPQHSYSQPPIQSPTLPISPVSSVCDRPYLKKACTEGNKLLSTLLTIEASLDKLLAMPDISVTDDEIKYMSVLSDLADRELVITISWAKQVPGFINLSLSDQMNLLQCSWLDILCFNVVQRSCPYDGNLVYADDFVVPIEKLKDYNCPLELDAMARKLALRVSGMHLTQEEYVLMKALILCNPEANVEKTELINQLRNKIQDALIDYVQTSECSGGLRRLGDLYLLLPTLTQLKLLCRSFWYNVRQDSRIPMHKLFLEMLEFETSS